jgi:hypothetical protein
MPAKKRARRVPQYAGYLVEIGGWDWSYSFAVGHDKRQLDPYSEYRHMKVVGKILRPAGLKAESAELTFLPKVEDNEANRMRQEPRAVGSLHLYSNILHGLLSMPADALPPVLTVLAAGKFKFVVLDGERLRWGKALIRHYSIDTFVHEDDYPPE